MMLQQGSSALIFGQGAGVKRPIDFLLSGAKKAKVEQAEGLADASGALELPPGNVGEVRFGNSDEAQLAVMQLNGSELGGVGIACVLDENSKDGSKMKIYGLPDGLSWKQLKDHCAQCGTVSFAGINTKGNDGAKGLGGKGSVGDGSGRPLMGEVRFETADQAAAAFPLLQGSSMDGVNIISVQIDENSQDGTKMILSGIPAGSQWQELKDHCKQAGQVAFCAVEGDRSGAGKGFKGFSMPRGAKGQPMMHAMGGGGASVGEVRYDDPAHAQLAMRQLNGSVIGESQIFIQADQASQDGSKLIVHGLAAGTQWQEVKDHFGTIGQVAFVNVAPPPGGFMQQMHSPQAGVYMRVGSGFGGGGGYQGGGSVGSYLRGGGFGGGQQRPMTGKGMGNAMQGGGGGLVGEIRYDNPQNAQDAVMQLNGAVLQGSTLTVQLDYTSVDQSKIIVMGVPASVGWKELKEEFGCVGQVAFCNVKGQ